MIELEDEPATSLELASPWEFATWQRNDETLAAADAPAEPENEQQLQLADPWEFIKWKDPKESASPDETASSNPQEESADPARKPDAPEQK